MPDTTADPPAPTLLHRSRSEHHEIFVYEQGTSRFMTFGDPATSPWQALFDVQDPLRVVPAFAQVFIAVTAFHPRPARVLCLGVGGGMVLTALRQVFPQATVDAVDIDPAVIAAGREWFGLSDADGRLRLHAADARRFMADARANGRRWDVILHDVFDNDYTPLHLMTTEFHAEAAAVLDAQGVIAINSFARGPLFAHELATCCASFRQAYLVRPEGSNRVIVGFPGQAPDFNALGANLKRHAPALARAGIDGHRVAGTLWPIATTADAAAVLHDRDGDDPRIALLRRQPMAEAEPAAGTA